MSAGKELQNQFKAAAFKSPDEVEAFVAAAESPAPADLLKLLDVVTGKAPEALLHKQRLAVFARLVEKAPDKSLFTPFVKALKAADPVVRSTLAALLPRVNSPTEHAGLVEHLRSPDATLRRLAAAALEKIGGGKTIFDLLSRALAERDFAGRMESMEILVGFAKHMAVPALQAVLTVGSQAERIQALKHLGDTRAMAKDPASALKVIATALDGQAEPVLVQAILSFGALCSEDDYFEYIHPFVDFESIGVAKAAIDGLRRFSSMRVVNTLERKLRSGPRTLRLAVLSCLEAIATDDVLPALVEALGHKQIAVRNRAGEVLQHLSVEGKLDVARTAIWLLRSRDVNVRRMATEVIRSVPDPEQTLWPKLLALLRDEDWWVRERVMDALIELGGTLLTAHMVGMLGDRSDVVRRFAVNVLSRLKDPRALRSLVQTATTDPDWWVKETAISAVAIINDARAVPYLVHILGADPPLQSVCIQALMDMGAKGAAAQIAQLTSSADPDVRLLAITALDKFDASEHATLVAKLADDPVLRVRNAVTSVMARWRITAAGGAVAVPLLDRLLALVAQQEGDDLIIAAGRPAYVKKAGKTNRLSDEVLTGDNVKALILPHLSTEQVIALQALQDVDYSHEVKSEGLRFRANVFNQLSGLSGVFRRIRGKLPEIETLGLPPLVRTFGDLKNGLVLVGGPTGSGKSTTLAALIDYINRTSSRHIIALEDPIEVIHRRKLSLVNQREIGAHTRSFSAALRSTLREDPNVILVGEMRDLITIEFTVIAAETGHLVFGTVHTVSAATTVDRMISAFPPGQQEQVRSTVADSLRAVICQYLLSEKTGGGRVLAVELMVNNEAVANLIRKGKAFQLPSIIATSREQGMQLMDNDLLRLVKEGRISAEDGYVKAVSKKEFEPFMNEVEKAATMPKAITTTAAVPSAAIPKLDAGAKPPKSAPSSKPARSKEG